MTFHFGVFHQHRYSIVFLLTTAVLFLLGSIAGWNLESPPDFMSFYSPVGKNLASGYGLLVESNVPGVRYPPGYPLVLAGLYSVTQYTGLSERTVLVSFVLVTWGLASVVFYRLAEDVLGSKAIMAYLLWLTYPFNLWLTLQMNVEILFLPIFLTVVYFVWRLIVNNGKEKLLALATGVLVGVSCLVRPIAIFLGLIVAVVLYFSVQNSKTTRMIMMAMILLGNVIAILPWEIWAYSRTGQWIPLSSGDTASLRDGLTFAVRSKNYRRSIEIDEDIMNIMLKARDLNDQGAFVSNSSILSFLYQQLRENPFSLAKLISWKMARSWYGTDAIRPEERQIRWLQMIYLGLGLCGGFMAWKLGRNVRAFILTSLVFVFYFWAMTTMALPILRYMVPVMSLILLFASLPVYSLFSKVIDRMKFGRVEWML